MRAARLFTHSPRAVIAALLLLLIGSSTAFGELPIIVAVEEDWELEVGQPTSATNAPQGSTFMTPFNTADSTYFLFNINHHTHPVYGPGGLQVQRWNSSQIVDYSNSPESQQLTQVGETVRWTQSLSLQDGLIAFAIKDGSSTSWGSFGGQGNLSLTMSSSSLDTLIGYNPLLSVQESGISYAGNRVASLRLLQIRWITETGETYVVSAPIDVDTDLDPWD